LVEFTVQVEASDYSMNCVVYKATGWTMGNEIIEDEKYLSAYIKWDGCSHFWFGDEDKYQHLCGKTAVDNHCKVLQAVWELAENSTIPRSSVNNGCFGVVSSFINPPQTRSA
jgi:hypothetical protein